MELEAFCGHFGFGCEALYAVRFNYRPWFFLRLKNLEPAGEGFKVEGESVMERGTTVEGL